MNGQLEKEFIDTKGYQPKQEVAIFHSKEIAIFA